MLLALTSKSLGLFEITLFGKNPGEEVFCVPIESVRNFEFCSSKSRMAQGFKIKLNTNDEYFLEVYSTQKKLIEKLFNQLAELSAQR